jgi:AraC-like DNA-binding protein
VYLWDITFQVYGALESFPAPLHAACEIQKDESYYVDGRARTGNDILFVYTLSGSGVFKVGDKKYQLSPGIGFLCLPSDPDIAWYYPAESDKAWKFVWISFAGKVAEAMVREMNGKYGYIYHISENSPIIHSLMSLPRNSSSVYHLMPHIGAGMVNNIIMSLAASVESAQVADPDIRLIQGAQEMIIENIESAISVADIAAKFNISREHFSRLFKEHTGQSPGEYILQQKIKTACRLLKNSELSCKEIAALLDYNNQTNFSRAFRMAMHITPKEFRHSSIFYV